MYYWEFENRKLAYVKNFNFYHVLPKTVLFGCSLNSDKSIPEDIEEQLSFSSFHSGSAKVCHVSYVHVDRFGVYPQERSVFVLDTLKHVIIWLVFVADITRPLIG